MRFRAYNFYFSRFNFKTYNFKMGSEKIRAKFEIEQLREEEQDPKINFKIDKFKKDLNSGMGFVNPHSTIN